MLASALRSLLVVQCESSSQTGEISSQTLLDLPLGGGAAVSLDWDSIGSRAVLAVGGSAGNTDRLLLAALPRSSTSSAPRPEEVHLPAGAGIGDVCVRGRAEEDRAWAAVACSDGALRIVNISPTVTPSIARAVYSHGVAATAVHLSHDCQCMASGSASSHVVVQPFHGGPGPVPLPGLGVEEKRTGAITSLRFSQLRQDVLAAADACGNLQVWDASSLRHMCKFAQCHKSAARSLCFSAQNADLLISGGDDAQLIFWDVQNACEIRKVRVESGISSLTYHQGGYLLAAGTSTGNVLIFDLRMLGSRDEPAKPGQRVSAHQTRGGGTCGSVSALAFAPFEVGWRPRAALPEPLPEPPAACAVRSSQSQGGDDSPVTPKASNVLPKDEPNDGITSATLASMLNRLSSRAAASSAPGSTAQPNRTVPRSNAASLAGRLSTSSLGSQSSLPAAGVPVSASEGSTGLRPAAGGADVPRAAVNGSGNRPFSFRALSSETSAAAGRPTQDKKPPVSRYSISTPEPAAPAQPWWDSSRQAAQVPEMPPPAPAAPAPVQSSQLAAAVAEVLEPVLQEVRRKLEKELQETQCALLEQNFRLHAELRRDVEELRAEVQQLKGELRNR